MPSNENIISEAQVAYSLSPITSSLSNDIVCSNDTTFNLRTKDTEALGAQSTNDFRVSYHVSQSDAISGVMALDKDKITLIGPHTIYVRTTSIENSNCFDASQQFNLEVIENPPLDFSEELFLCSQETSGTIGEIITNPNYSYQCIIQGKQPLVW